MTVFRARGGGMDRDTLMDDLDLIFERRRDDELPGEWDWEPPSGRARVPIAAEEARVEETDTEASSEGASDPVDGPQNDPENDTEDEAEGDADDEDHEDD
jgi:hypothetical protein